MKESAVWLHVANLVHAGMYIDSAVDRVGYTAMWRRLEDMFGIEIFPSGEPEVLAALFLREMALDDERRAKRGRK